MPLGMKALLSMAAAIAAVVALVTLAGTLAHVLGGTVALVAMLLFTRVIMAFAAEPGRGRRAGGSH